MDGFELLAVVVFFLIGYWVVDFFWPKKKTDAVPPADTHARTSDNTAHVENVPKHKEPPFT